MFFSRQLCLSDLSCVSENLAVFFRRQLCFFRPQLCLSDLSCGCKFDILGGRYSLLSKQKTGMSKTTTRIFIPHERSKTYGHKLSNSKL